MRPNGWRVSGARLWGRGSCRTEGSASLISPRTGSGARARAWVFGAGLAGARAVGWGRKGFREMTVVVWSRLLIQAHCQLSTVHRSTVPPLHRPPWLARYEFPSGAATATDDVSIDVLYPLMYPFMWAHGGLGMDLEWAR